MIGSFAGGCRPIVASAAIGQIGVIDLGASPRGGGLMTGFTRCCGHKVAG